MKPIDRPILLDEKDYINRAGELRAEIKGHEATLKAAGKTFSPMPEDVFNEGDTKRFCPGKPGHLEIIGHYRDHDIIATVENLEKHAAIMRLNVRFLKMDEEAAAKKPATKPVLSPKPSDIKIGRPTAVKGEAAPAVPARKLSIDDQVTLAKGGTVTPKRTFSFDELVAERKKQTSKH
jgi:hypothetical protein